jgi:hypothetical protein
LLNSRIAEQQSDWQSEDWGKLVGDVPAATAILDRLLAQPEVIQITGRSYRLRRQAAEEKPSKEKDGTIVAQNRPKASTGSGGHKSASEHP